MPVRFFRLGAAIALVASAAGCTASFVTTPGAPVSNIDFHSSPGLTLNDIQIDNRSLGTFAQAVDVEPGAHAISLSYAFESENCDPSDSFCEVETSRGLCEGSMNTRDGRKYLVTVDGGNNLVVIRISAKGYFDFSEREDEPNVGAGHCRELSQSTSFRRHS